MVRVHSVGDIQSCVREAGKERAKQGAKQRVGKAVTDPGTCDHKGMPPKHCTTQTCSKSRTCR